MRINQNIAAFNAYRNLSSTNNVMGKSLEKLSSGFRINRAADDAAGLVISQGLRAQVSGLRQATRNAQDGISVVQTAEGALNEVHSMLNRMRDLAVQSANASNDSAARTAANNEITQLKAEITRIKEQTSFGSQNLLDGSLGVTPGELSAFDADGSYAITSGDDFTVAVNGGAAVTVELQSGTYSGAELADHMESAIKSALQGSAVADDNTAASQIRVSFESVGAGGVLTVSNESSFSVALADGTGTPLADTIGSDLIGTAAAATGTAANFQVGANNGDTISVSSIDLDDLDVSGDVLSATNAGTFIDTMDTAIDQVSGWRGELGAVQNRFESTINNLQVTTENLAASESRIRDTDMALEMVSFTRHQILQQAGTAMLGQANALPQGVLRLLG